MRIIKVLKNTSNPLSVNFTDIHFIYSIKDNISVSQTLPGN